MPSPRLRLPPALLARQFTTSSCAAAPSSPRVPPSPNYPLHAPINAFQRTLLTFGSAIASLKNPERHDMVACLSETFTGGRLPHLLNKMYETESGRRIMRDRPRISSDSVDLVRLGEMRKGTLGREYADWLKRWGVSPDTRDPVRYIDDPAEAYLLQRYRESHDLYHVLLSFSVSLHSELVIKWFETANLSLPMTFLSSVFGPLRMEAGERRRLTTTFMPWALREGGRCECLLGVYWEEEWETDLDELRARLGLTKAPMSMKEFRAETKRLKAMKQSAV
ncbi:hypothetical protein MNV49_001431 [Pseudohyphozyma bogoriensis]|nr:hypothetical protein MNV49_001431 [Pseudohyphozyma bogoriensis]